MKKKIFLSILGLLLVIICIAAYFLASFSNTSLDMFSEQVFYASDFNIEVVKSDIDYNNNGVDDFSDILEGAKIEAANKPTYRSAYYNGGYPPDDEGVCTDVIWRALKHAGYNLKELVDEDIKEKLHLYTNITEIDTNIDFRRVKNLKVFFENNTLVLTNNPYEISEWMPGDIVIFHNSHIAIISDKRNSEGIPYIIHNSGQPDREEDKLIWWYEDRGITGHYCFILK